MRLFDEKGLYLEVSPAGGKWWRLKYRIDGKGKRISLGTYPDTSLKAARDKRDQARQMLAAGGDPSAERQTAKKQALEEAADSFRSVPHGWMNRLQGHCHCPWLPGAVFHRGERMWPECGRDPGVIERQLAHVERNEVRAPYHRSPYLAGRAKLMQWWADYLDGKRVGNVRPLRSKRA